MKLVMLDGLKGSGKSTLVKRIKKEGYLFEKKFSKGESKMQPFLINFRKKYYKKFKNIDSSLGLIYYSNFLNSLKGRKRKILLERGLITLPIYGYYGYVHNKENMSLEEYLRICEKLYVEVLKKLNLLRGKHYIVLLETSKGELVKRIKIRKRKIPSDMFFLKNIGLYLYLEQKYERILRNNLNINVIVLRNDNKLCQKINFKIIKCLLRSL